MELLKHCVHFNKFFEIYESILFEDSDKSVLAVQAALKTKNNGKYAALLGTSGPNGDGVDGVYGPKTKAAIIAFQKDNGIQQTGFVGPKTAPLLGVQQMNSHYRQTKDAADSSASAQPTEAPKQNQAVPQTGCPSVKTSPYLRDFGQEVTYWKNWLNGPQGKAIANKDPYAYIDQLVANDAKIYRSMNIEPRAACQVALIGLRPIFQTKHIFIVDSKVKMVYLFAPPASKGATRKLIAKDAILSGKNRQVNDAVSIAKAFETYEEVAKRLGYPYDATKHFYKDPATGEDADSKIWAEFDKTKTRFMPAGVYTSDNAENWYDPEYAGPKDKINVLSLKNWEGKAVSQALHGYYKEIPRDRAMSQIQQIIKDPNNQSQVNDFLNRVSSGNLNLNFSYGCINLTPRFLEKARPYFNDSVVFSMAEYDTNYLVQNTEDFFNKGSQVAEPSALFADIGAEIVSGNTQAMA